ncbi:DUF721 domain-containing protein [Methylovirgula ligni]|uniref:Uncharacterized protein n=1 Tax=Methylovirgula ligni TaxID=569860 RepID=A0A3D9YY76_9HYPH|nr:DciA family protein [Methylovirgula ligni]QAY94434.1 DUF721 domain-containing protein [Methylovirgula ligni]REF87713.1 hypothetical protein DES32_1341 [Methylovirgula ligni]
MPKAPPSRASASRAASSRGPWSRPLADLVDAAIDPVLARQGFGESQIVLYWEDIVGERLAAMSEPMALKWPPRGKASREHAPATLVVRVESGFALELQHLAGVVIERVNAHLGFACVDRIGLRQGPLLRKSARKTRPAPPSEAQVAAAAAIVGDIAEAPLRQALTRLGARIIEHSLDRKPTP